MCVTKEWKAKDLTFLFSYIVFRKVSDLQSYTNFCLFSSLNYLKKQNKRFEFLIYIAIYVTP
jgi:hypothetical protein